MPRLIGKRCLITGAASGIGLACARYMQQEGALVALSDLDAERALEASHSLPQVPVIVQLDVTSAAQWTQAVQQAHDQMGGLNVLVNNAGICLAGNVETLSEDDWDRTVDVDLKSVYLGCKAALPVMADHAPGSIVNISSISAMVAGHNMAAYNAAKAGVHLLSKSVALHCARQGYQIRSNSIHPAFVDTGMVDQVVGGDPRAAREKLAKQIPLGRIGTVEDVALAAIYLASDESSFMTGAEIKLDGGLSAM